MEPLPAYSEPDIAWIEPGFAIGSCPYAGDRQRIYERGIRAVVALYEPDERANASWVDLGVEVVSVPTRDWAGIPAANFDRVVEVISACLEADKPVLLHCLAGINRAPTLAAAVLCKRHGLTVEAALEVVRRARPAACPTLEQETSLREWLRMRASASPRRA